MSKSKTATSTQPLSYQSGFGNEFASQAIEGSLPHGQNSPQKVAHGLYAEQLSGTAFTAPRANNRRSWLYRIRPSSTHKPFKPMGQGKLRSAPFDEAPTPPNQLRWNPFPIPSKRTDFIDGLMTMAGNGNAHLHVGAAIHIYAANASMKDRFFSNADGEMLIVPQLGRLFLHTEMGDLDISPGEIAVIPRGSRFRVDMPDNQARGYVCENYGTLFRLPELGPIGSNGLANARDFLYPVAAFDEREYKCQLVNKFDGKLWVADIDHSPLDVVAWHGNYAPYKYNLAHFNCINTVSFDHCDPSIYTVLTSPSEIPGTANVDFVIFPPRWMVAEHTFRPPWFHRNVMSEFMGLIHGQYDAKAKGFIPGGASLHNCMSAHGADSDTFEVASKAELKPVYQGNTLAFMFETRFVNRPTKFALQAPQLDDNYFECWQGLQKKFNGKSK